MNILENPLREKWDLQGQAPEMQPSTILWVLSLLVKNQVSYSCSPADLDPSLIRVTLSSHDSAYRSGDIHLRNCSQYSDRQYIGWCPDPHDVDPHVQVDLNSFKAVHGIRFQTHYSLCGDLKHNYSIEAFLATFDLQYVTAGDPEKNWVLYSEDLPALRSTGPERMYEFPEPLVTASFRILPKLRNIYPCFRFSVVACEATDLCPANWCLNGGQCSGSNLCTCSQGYYGERCNNSISDVEPENYDFLKITNNTLETPDATFDVIGNVTIETYRKRDSHHGHHHGHAISCHGHNSYVQYSHSHYHHHHHRRSESQYRSSRSHHGTCMSNFGHHSHGFTTSMHVNFGHHQSHHASCIYSNGGNLHGHQGASLHYSNNHLHFNVQSASHHWTVSAPCNLHGGQWHHIQSSWHPQTGVSLHVNNQHIGSSSHAHTNSHQYTQSVPLRLCHDHQTTTISTTTTTTNAPTTVTASPSTNTNTIVNVYIQISGLNIYPVSQHQLTVAGLKGPYTVPTASTALPTLPTTSSLPVSATTTPVAKSFSTLSTNSPSPASATTTLPTTSTGSHMPVCYSCTSQGSLGSCQTKVRCQTGEICTLFQDRTGYTSKCLDKQLCFDAKKVAGSSCWECCESYLCNDRCSAHANVTCADKSTCATLISTGFNVCKDPKLSVDYCRKTCKKC